MIHNGAMWKLRDLHLKWNTREYCFVTLKHGQMTRHRLRLKPICQSSTVQSVTYGKFNTYLASLHDESIVGLIEAPTWEAPIELDSVSTI